jgi:hypothetical protein
MGVYRSAIVGLGYDPKRASAAAELREGQAVDLVRDYDNDHDENAVAVFDASRMLGFIPARHSVWVAEILDEERAVAARVVSIVRSGVIWRSAEAVDLDIYTNADAENPLSRAEIQMRKNEKETHRRAWDAAKGGLQILRWLGEAGKTDHNLQRYVMDTYIQARAADRGLTVTSAISQRMRDDVMAMTGSRSTAMTAARKLAMEDDDVEALAPSVTAMVKADSQFSADEADAVKDLLKTLRRSRARSST